MTWLARLLRLGILLALVAFLLWPRLFEPLLAPLTAAGQPALYARSSVLELAAWHLGTVAVAIGASSLVAVTLAVLVTRPFGAALLPAARTVVNVGQSIPPVAVLALAVPIAGFGIGPTLLALFLYGLLPTFENSLTGLTGIPSAVLEAGEGVGFDSWQRLWRIELPLALPLILVGIRIAAVIGLSTATIGSTVAAKGLGEIIMAGLIADNLAFLVQGAFLVAGSAILLHEGFVWVQRRCEVR